MPKEYRIQLDGRTLSNGYYQHWQDAIAAQNRLMDTLEQEQKANPLRPRFEGNMRLKKKQIAKGYYDAATLAMKPGVPFSIFLYLSNMTTETILGHSDRTAQDSPRIDRYIRRYLTG